MLFQSIKIALKSIFANKMRALLTMLGIIIGVVALVVLVSLVSSATSAVTSQIASLGNDMFTVSIRDDHGKPLKLSDLEKIGEEYDAIGLVAPASSSNATAKHGSDTYSVSVTGTTNAYFHIMSSTLETGRFLLSTDVENKTPVVVLSNETADAIYGRTDVVGLTLSMDGLEYLIVGVLDAEENMMSSFMQSYEVYIPYTVAERSAASSGNSGMGGMGASGGDGSSNSGITTFYAAAASSEQIDLAEVELTSFLLARYANDSDAFSLRNNNSLSETMSSVTDTFALLLGGIAGISLLVGGIGIMNIMLVSVTERTREIGIRKAVGASRLAITLQFLIEALVICLIGCAIGIAISGLVLLAVNIAASDGSTTYGFSPTVVLIAIVFSTLIGVLFGLYPANKAARMRPIEALRYE